MEDQKNSLAHNPENLLGVGLQITFFFLLFAIVSVVLYFVFEPFLGVLAVAGIFAVMLHPLYRKILPWFRENKTVTSLAVVLLALVFVAVPLSFIGSEIVQEAQNLYSAIEGNELNTLEKIALSAEGFVQRFFPDFSLDLRSVIGSIASWFSEHIGSFVSGTAQFLFHTLLFIIALFFFVRDGDRFASYMIHLSPLEDKFDREILTKLTKTVNAVVKGMLAVAIIQGVLVGMGLAIFHVPQPVLWGVVAALSALVPGVGTGLVIVPAVAFLLFADQTLAAVGLAAWGAVLVGMVDNFLVPYFYSRGLPVHPFFVLLSVLGGLLFFGTAGFLFGPLILSLFVTLLHIYHVFILREVEESVGS